MRRTPSGMQHPCSTSAEQHHAETPSFPLCHRRCGLRPVGRLGADAGRGATLSHAGSGRGRGHQRDDRRRGARRRRRPPRMGSAFPVRRYRRAGRCGAVFRPVRGAAARKHRERRRERGREREQGARGQGGGIFEKVAALHHNAPQRSRRPMPRGAVLRNARMRAGRRAQTLIFLDDVAAGHRHDELDQRHEPRLPRRPSPEPPRRSSSPAATASR